MRIVNKERDMDVTYDNIQVVYQELDRSEEYIGHNHVVAAVLDFVKQGDKWCVLGDYESREKCLEVMERIRNSYARGAKIYYMPED